MNVAGIGIVFTRGRGIQGYAQALFEGWMPPSQVPCAAGPERPFAVYRVQQETLKDSAVLRRTRRADRFSKMAVLAACDAVKDSGIELHNAASSLGVIVATGFGPHVTTFRFLDDILDYGEAEVSPMVFSHSVHNAAASYIASTLDCRGPTLTVTQFDFSFHHGLLLARAWLQEKRCEYVLVGSVDDCGTVMEYICSQKLRIADDGRIRPFHFSAFPKAVPGEGSVFFLMTLGQCLKQYCQITGVALTPEHHGKNSPDVCILDADGMLPDETVYSHVAMADTYFTSYAPLFGSMPIGSGFSCAAAALMLRNQMHYAAPVQHNPHSIKLCVVTEPSAMETIQCVRYNCGHEQAVIELKR
jgi:3-oxoacyl-[acyl-carrier-protein] synthase II